MRPAQLEVLAFAGSLRRGSWNRRLLEAAVGCAGPGVHVRVVDALRDVPVFDEDLEADAPEAVRRLRAQVAGADALLVATPEYNQSLPGGLKNALDWLSRPAPGEVLVGKPVAVVGATTGRWGTRLAQAALRQTLVASGALVLPGPALCVAQAQRAFDAEGRLVDAAVREGLTAVLAALAAWTARVGAPSPRPRAAPGGRATAGPP